MEAEDPTLKRPRFPYTCSNLNIDENEKNPVGNGCGPGTKRPPKKSCIFPDS
jgi:hypothetical protein